MEIFGPILRLMPSVIFIFFLFKAFSYEHRSILTPRRQKGHKLLKT